MAELSLINGGEAILPTKTNIETAAASMVAETLSGDNYVLDDVLRLKAIAEAIKKYMDDDRIREAVVNEVQKYGKKADFKGATFELRETGVKYDFSSCGDSEYNSLIEQKRVLDEKIKEREALLKRIPYRGTTLLDEDTGEYYHINPPVRSATEGYITKFPK